MPDDSSATSPSTSWGDRRARKRAEADARHLVDEARRILRKKSYRIPEAVKNEVENAVVRVEGALGQPDTERLREAMSALDETMSQHLAFARKSTVREYSESIGVAVFIALLLRAFVVEAFQIPSGSMIPTLEIGDHIFVSKFSYGLGIPFTDKKILELAQPKRGDVIVFKYPLGTDVDYIKRVVGLPGDKVEVRRNEIFINGRPMVRELSSEPCHYAEGPIIDGLGNERECELWMETLDEHRHKTIFEPGPGKDWGPRVVPPGNVFVMGDNRDNSNDSRVWGFVPHELIKGRALVVWWSRGPTSDGTSLVERGKEWLAAIRWRRFFHRVE